MCSTGFLTRDGRIATCLALTAALIFAQQAKASVIAYNFDTVFSGSTPPAAPGPWIQATFQDVTPGTVDLTVTNVGVSTGEFISGVYFNLKPTDSATNLTLTLTSSHGSFTIPTISLGTDSFKADGDGKYDILLSFDTSNGKTFTVNDSVTYRLTGIAGLTAVDFEYLSAPAGGSGPFYAAAHYQGTPPNNGGSCWVEPDMGPQIVTVPEPAPQLLMALAAGLWFGARRMLAKR
jgi:hypothetical protein